MPAGLALLARMRQHAHEFPNACAYRQPDGRTLSYRELARSVDVVAHRVAQRPPRGSVVILSCPNRIEYPSAFLGVIAAGCSIFPVSAEASDAELRRAAEESGAAGVIGDERAQAVLAELPLRFSIDQATSLPPSPHPDLCGDLLLQSSGTTGLPKIVRRTGASLDAVSQAVAEAIRFSPEDRVLMTVPLTHSYGLEHGLLAPIWAGSAVHLCRGLDLPAMSAQLSTGGITVLPSVPAAFEMLCGPRGQDLTAPTLRVAYAAGAPLPASVFEAFAARFGVNVAQLYGATEIGSVTFNAPWDQPFDRASVGRGMHGVSIRILDLDSGATPLPAGDQGQVAIRANSMFAGYLHGEADLIDGHFPTGDLGYLDQSGRLFLTGRIKLLIDIGGMKVNPLEVEAVLQQHKGVADCVVVPLRQSETVNRLKAVIVAKDPRLPPELNELRDLARRQLAGYKVPRTFELRDSLPRSATGKVQRHLVEAG